ncbi:MAG: hypothetical protein KKD46_05960 [Euryarchaeota archaeon]|nr:hypothetical protein [Euryarchaeota archaeon]MBU4340442.1 hypothetical protein [Euryarchaeota archaeon]MCG2735052.1 hypothetical protein [Candidatus Methanoperedenaceae archaeon]
MKKTKASTATAVAKGQRNKAIICATVSPWLKTRLEKMVDGKEFSSVSDIVSLACHEFMIRYFSDRESMKSTVAEESTKQ